MLVFVRVLQIPFQVVSDAWRLDQAIVPGRLEHVDPGYASYIGMLLMDHRYNNPIVNVFVHVVCADMMKSVALQKDTVRLRRYELLAMPVAVQMNKDLRDEIVKLIRGRRKRQIQFRWWLASMLALNKVLRAYRRDVLQAEKKKKEGAVDNLYEEYFNSIDSTA